MEKIGINKSDDKYINFFQKINKNYIITIDECNINQITSTIVENEILDYEFLESIEMIRVTIRFLIKLIYSIDDSNLLYVYDEEYLSVQYIYVDEYIEGISIKNLVLKNKIKIQLNIENISTKLIKNNIIVNFFYIVSLKHTHSFYISMVVETDFGENIYTCFSNGKNLNQNTFSINNKYNNLDFLYDGIGLVYIGENTEKTEFIINKFKDKNEIKYENVNVIKNVNKILSIDNNKLIIISKFDGIYLFNIKRNSLESIFSNLAYSDYSNAFYDRESKNIYFLCSINNTKSLCVLDKKYNFKVLFNSYDVIDYTLNKSSSDALLSTNKDKTQKIYILSLISQSITPIQLNFKYNGIIKVRFYKENNFEKIIIILYSYENIKYIALYNINNMSLTILYKDEYIKDFEIDKFSQDVYLCINNSNASQIIRINKLWEKESIVKLPNSIKSFFIKA